MQALEPNLKRALRMLARIRQDLIANPNPAPWLSAARTLSKRLLIGEDSWFHFAELFTECFVEHGFTHDPELVRIYAAMEAIERAHGLGEDDFWHIHEAPDEWQALDKEWKQRADDIVNAYLREWGHADVAELRENKREEFNGRTTMGRRELWGPDGKLDDNFE